MIKNLLVFFLVLVPFCFISKELFLKSPPVWPDEAVLFDTAKHFLDKGVIATDIYGGEVWGLEKKALWYPPIFFYTLALWIKVWGSDLATLRLFSFVLGLGSLVIIFNILKKIFNNSLLIFFGLLLIASEWGFQNASRVVRMDMFVFFWQLLSLWFFLKATENRKIRDFIYCGIFSALAVLTHPIGLVVLSIYILNLILSSKTRRYIPILIVPLIIGLALWLITNREDWGLFLSQIQFQLVRKAANEYAVWTFFTLYETFRYIYIYYIISFIGFVYISRMRREKHDLWIVTGSAVSAFWVVLGKEVWYILFFQPFGILLIVSFIRKLFQTSRKIVQAGAYLFALIPLFLQIHYLIEEAVINRNSHFDYGKYTQEIRKNLPKEGSIFLSTIPDPYFGLLNNNINLYEMPYKEIPKEKYIKLLDKSDVLVVNLKPDEVLNRYIMLNTREKKELFSKDYFTTTLVILVPRDKRVY